MVYIHSNFLSHKLRSGVTSERRWLRPSVNIALAIGCRRRRHRLSTSSPRFAQWGPDYDLAPVSRRCRSSRPTSSPRSNHWRDVYDLVQIGLGFFLPIWVSYHSSGSAIISFFFVLQRGYSRGPYTDLHAKYVKRRGFAQGCAFWGFEHKSNV